MLLDVCAGGRGVLHASRCTGMSIGRAGLLTGRLLQVASVFSNAKLAAICAPILHFSALMPRCARPLQPTWLKTQQCMAWRSTLFIGTAEAFCCRCLYRYPARPLSILRTYPAYVHAICCRLRSHIHCISRACWLTAAIVVCRYIFFRTGEPQALFGKGLVSLLSPSAFTFAADLFASYEGAGDGVGWGDLWEDSFPLGFILVMLTIDIKLYATAGWYLEKVMPGAHGPRLPVLFPLSLQYWQTGDASDVPSVGQVLARAGQPVIRLCSGDKRGFKRITGDDMEAGRAAAGAESAPEGIGRDLQRHSSGLTPRGSGLRGLPGQGHTVFAEMHNMRKVCDAAILVTSFCGLPKRLALQCAQGTGMRWCGCQRLC